MMMTLLFLREDAGHFSKDSEGKRAAPERERKRERQRGRELLDKKGDETRNRGGSRGGRR